MLKIVMAAALAASSPFALAPAFAAPAQAQLSSLDAAKAFGARENIIHAAISPAGDQLSLVVAGEGRSTILNIVNLKTGAVEAVTATDGKELKITSCGWVSEQRLICRQYGITDREGMMLDYVRLAALDNSGENILPLGANVRNQVRLLRTDGRVLDWLDGTGDKVLIAREYAPMAADLTSIGSTAEGLGVDLLDTRSGDVQHLERADTTARLYLTDGQGHVRMKGNDDNLRLGYQTRGVTTFRYRLAGRDDWGPFSTYSSVTNEGMWPVAVDGTSNSAFVLEKTNGRDALYRVALDGSMAKTLIFAHPDVDVSGIVRVGRQGRVIGASYATDEREVVYFEPRYKALGSSLEKTIPNLPLIRFEDSNADETRHLIHAASDINPGRYFLFDSETRRLTDIAASRPELDGIALAPMKAITYKAADGTEIPAYLTLPVGSDGKNLPAIVMPHGGPASRDEWGFDWWVQFYANRGFAVLQPNFRGSAGYGDEWFQQNGFKSWKIAIGDVTDAGRWLVDQGIADPAKLAIVGWSYGGYAALQSNVVDPDLFKAVVAVAPVTDLGLLRKEQRGFVNMRVAQEYIGDGPHLEEGSPAQHAERFKAPVLMFHGDRDLNVEIRESRYMDSQLHKAGRRSQLVEYQGLDHQLDDSKARADMLARSDAFLRQALKL